MAVTKELVCLANSRKHGGRCVAGIEIESNNWIRLVSASVSHEVSPRERQYLGGVEPAVLDIVSMSVVAPRPDGFQRENWLLDPAVRWQKEGRVGWTELCSLEQRPERLWVNGYQTAAGCNDCVPVEHRDSLVDSLKLIRVESVTLNVSPALPHATDKRPRVRARFEYGNEEYELKVTDPVYEERLRAKVVGSFQLGESYLTVSLGEEFKGHFYKLVASIVERDDVEPGGG